MKLLIITQKVDENDQLLGFFIQWIKEFAFNFEQIKVLCLEKGEFQLPKNVIVKSFNKDRGASKIVQLFNFFSLIARENEYDAVFVHMNPIWIILGAWYWRLFGKKIYFWYAHKSVTSKLKLAEKFSDVIFTSTAEGFRFNSNKIRVVGQGIDTNYFSPDKFNKPKTNTLLSVGRIAPVKNYEPLIMAIKIMKDEGFNLSVTMIGEPALGSDFDYQNKIESMTRDLDLQSIIKFTGKIKNSELPNFYRKNKIFVNLSQTGSLDKTILEAMASGCIVLSSNDSAKSFLPEEFIIKSDNPSKLSEKIIEALQINIGEELRDYVVKNHSLSKLIRSISDSIKIS